MPEAPVLFERKRAVALHLALSGGFVTVTVVFGALLYLGNAPFLRGEQNQFLPSVIAIVGLAPMLLGLVWARPRVPIRPSALETEAYWRDTDAGPGALLTWVLWEGSGMIGAVGTLLTGSLATGVVAAIGLALLLLHGPGYYESRGS
jgi:hypothetical protein